MGGKIVVVVEEIREGVEKDGGRTKQVPVMHKERMDSVDMTVSDNDTMRN